MRWLNEPAEWARVAGELSVGVEPGTDFWRTTHYGPGFTARFRLG